MNVQDITFLEAFFIEASHPSLKEGHRLWIKILNTGFDFLNLLKANPFDANDLAAMKKFVEDNSIEEFHAVIETEAIGYLHFF